jgi:hypothetical protein
MLMMMTMTMMMMLTNSAGNSIRAGNTQQPSYTVYWIKAIYYRTDHGDIDSRVQVISFPRFKFVLFPFCDRMTCYCRATIEYLKRMLRAQRSNDCVLDSFSLSRVPPEVIISSTDYHGLVNLTSLDMRDNRLVMLTRGVEKLHRLTYLNLSYNDLYTVPAEVQELTQLTTLDVSHNALEAFPPGIGLMSQLINWEFDGNPKLRLPKNLLRTPVATEQEGFEVRLRPSCSGSSLVIAWQVQQRARVERTKKFLRTILEECDEVLWDDLGLETVLALNSGIFTAVFSLMSLR